MSRIIIDNQSDRDDWFALQLVRNVLKLGKISNDGTQHCYLSTFIADDKCYIVATMLNRKSEKFIVYNDLTTTNK